MAETVDYRITLADGTHREFSIDLDEPSGFVPPELPEWTRLDHGQCPICPLAVEDHPRCPAAAFMTPVVEAVQGLVSHTRVEVTVTSSRRTVILPDVDLQSALSALLGMILPLSGCPLLAYFRPMAHFHLPMATQQETQYRAASMYALAQWLRRKHGLPAEHDLAGLSGIYEDIKVVNRHLHGRLTDETSTDSPQNAVVILDTLAWLTPMAVDTDLAELSPLFARFLEDEQG